MSSIVDQIRVALNKRDGINEDLMRPLAEVYTHETRRVNERLVSAAERLQKGLRSEAIQAVLAHPSAMDAAAALDFAEVDEWFDILQFLGIPVPAPIRSDLVEQLNETIVEAQPMEALLKQHRRLALARAPLPWRLKVLRRLAELDPINAFWTEDISDYERTRHKQLPSAINHAKTNKDIAQLNSLLEEVNDPNWLSPPDKVHQKTIVVALEEFNSEQSLAELNRLGPLLHEAFCEFDEAHARQYLAQWRECKSDFRGQLPEPLVAQYEPTADWIAQLDLEKKERESRNTALALLEKKIDRNAPLHEVEQAYHKASIFDEPIPEELARRYYMLVEAKSLSKKRIFQAAIVGLISLAICIVGAFGWWQFEENKLRRLSAAESQLQSLLASADIVAARTFYDQLVAADTPTAQHANILTLAGQLESLESEERGRVEEFEGHLSRASAEDPADIDLSSLIKAEILAKSEAEKAAAFALRSRRERWEAEIAEQQSELLRAELLQQRRVLNEIEQQPASNQLVGTLAGAIAKLQPLSGQFPRAASTLHDQVDSEVQRARSLRNAILARVQKQQREEAAFANFLGSNSPADLTRNMKQYLSEFPSSNLSSDFAVVASEESLWRAADQWNELMKAATAVVSNDFSKDSVSLFNSAKQAIEFASHPAATPQVRNALQPILAVEKRREIFGNVFLGLEDSVLSDLYTIKEQESNKKNRYFVYKSYVENNQKRLFDEPAANRGVEVVDDSSGAVRNTTLDGKLASNPEPKATIDWLVGIGKTQEDKFLLDWEGEFVRLVAELFKRQELDHRLKEMLLQHILAGAAQGSESFRERLGSVLLLLNERENLRSTWYNPERVNTSVDPQIKSQVTDTLIPVYEQRGKLSDYLDTFRLTQFQWVGMLTRSEDGQMMIHLQSDQLADGGLYVIEESSQSPGTSKWIDVGTVEMGEISETANLNSQLAGRPVFLLSSNLTP